jgi:hypothetical protein
MTTPLPAGKGGYFASTRAPRYSVLLALPLLLLYEGLAALLETPQGDGDASEVKTNSYVDTDVKNGVTYWYLVSPNKWKPVSIVPGGRGAHRSRHRRRHPQQEDIGAAHEEFLGAHSPVKCAVNEDRERYIALLEIGVVGDDDACWACGLPPWCPFLAGPDQGAAVTAFRARFVKVGARFLARLPRSAFFVGQHAGIAEFLPGPPRGGGVVGGIVGAADSDLDEPAVRHQRDDGNVEV